MEVPSDLDANGRELWQTIHDQLKAQGTLAESDAELVEMYVRKLLLAKLSRVEAEKEPFVKGSKGQLVPHPGHRIAADAEKDAVALARALLLTPYARKQAGISAAQPSSALADVLS